ncbi:hypothetical protein GCM10010406_53310 [Streptomyces thermolineatus]|uniref:Uncharacterized protein n=1 Tax=Streptomyces thermolineatus TaxID=44033 RepID=A0ABP6AB51_9ACTN
MHQSFTQLAFRTAPVAAAPRTEATHEAKAGADPTGHGQQAYRAGEMGIAEDGKVAHRDARACRTDPAATRR